MVLFEEFDSFHTQLVCAPAEEEAADNANSSEKGAGGDQVDAQQGEHRLQQQQQQDVGQGEEKDGQEEDAKQFGTGTQGDNGDKGSERVPEQREQRKEGRGPAAQRERQLRRMQCSAVNTGTVTASE